MFTLKSRALVQPLLPRLILPLFLLAAGLIAPLCEGGLVGFEETGSMAQARADHTATLLSDGKVLVTSQSAGQSAELYDPANRTWATTGGLVAPRFYHTATLLPNGKVLVAGGQISFTSQAGAELYDPTTGTWTPTGSMNTRRRLHTATLLPNGKVLVAGGFVELLGTTVGGYATPTAELYDPASGTWATTASLAQPRLQHTATLLPNGKVLITGGDGWYTSGGIQASSELYDPATGTWTPTGSLNISRRVHTATLLPNGKVLVAGGLGNTNRLGSAELYDPASGTWSQTGSLGTARSGHTATLLQGGKVLVAGSAGAELYNPSSGTWITTGSLVTSRGEHTATLLSDGAVLVAGGRKSDYGLLASAELYGKPMPTLLNISTRINVRTGDKVLIGGFIITGTERKTLIVHGIGPSLPMTGTLADPVIEVHGPSGEFLGSNDNWKDAATRQQISDSGLAPSNDLESALWGTIDPGAYTVILSGKDGGTGIGSVEVYDLDQVSDSRLANISSRGFVDTGDNALIGGLIAGGGSPGDAVKVVVRAVGRSLSGAGVAGALGDPTVELHDANGTTIAVNDNWKTRPDGGSQQAEIEATGLQPTNDLESALVRTVVSGNYTAIVRGNNGTSGIGLIEVYHLP
jgi:WD40 repeat protein